MENLLSNYGAGAKFANWTSTVFNTGTALVSTYSATSGPDSTPGVTLSCTGTTGGVELVSGKVYVAPDTMLGMSVVVKASSVSPTLVPFSVAFSDGAGNAVLTYVPIASAVPASTNAIQYNSVVGVPAGAVTAIFTYAALQWSATGGYSEVVSSPILLGY